jgi:hypothetical protein
MSKLVQSVKDAWWITPNEKRSVMKYDDMDMDEMNTIYIPTGLMPIGDAAMGGQEIDLTDDYQQPNTGAIDAEKV